MKTRLLFLISFLAFQSLFAQTTPGIAVQGIARDAEKAALVDQLLTFTFDIQDPDKGTSYYKEEEKIKTDPYGVFSHIIGTSATHTGAFNEIPFGQAHMALVISVEGEVISNSPFQYAPYAKSADNGVPTGTIVAYAGTEANIPKGWILCKGQDLNGVDGATNLIALIGSTAPDLRGMFLRGTGTSPVNGEDGPALNATQQDAFETHSINATASKEGNHNHTLPILFNDNDGSSYLIKASTETGHAVEDHGTSYSGEHTHTITGSSSGGDSETRPVNYGVNYIIKL